MQIMLHMRVADGHTGASTQVWRQGGAWVGLAPHDDLKRTLQWSEPRCRNAILNQNSISTPSSSDNYNRPKSCVLNPGLPVPISLTDKHCCLY